ncbi:MAG: SprT family zinc-dependent metalloprotease [Betaproteobacteria bacterium]|jgi:hypothetical protein
MDRGGSRAARLGALLTGDLFPADTVEEPRSVVLQGTEVRYLLQRSCRRRRIAFRVDERGLFVEAPLLASIGTIEASLHATARWILRKLSQWAKRPAPRTRLWRSGEQLDYLGCPLTMLVVEDRLLPLTELGPDRVLRVGIPPAGSPGQVRAAVIAWYRRHARRHFPDRVGHFAQALGVELPRVMISDAATRWGSCNSRREVRLNWRLMQAPALLLDYVVAHEVAHLQHLDHSKRFWSAVERIFPEYSSARAALQAASRHYMSL